MSQDKPTKQAKRCPRCKQAFVETTKTTIGTKDARGGRRYGMVARCGYCGQSWWEGREG